MGLVSFTENDVKKVQIDEGIVVVDLGETSELILGPTRGGVELTATPSIRDIEFDGRRGKTKGLQVTDGEDVTLKVAVLCCSQENLALAIPGATVGTEDKKITPGNFGVIPSTAYLKNIAIITKTIDGAFKILKIKNPMHEGAFGFKANSKSENEHNLEMIGHYDYTNLDEKIWGIEESSTNPIAS